MFVTWQEKGVAPQTRNHSPDMDAKPLYGRNQLNPWDSMSVLATLTPRGSTVFEEVQGAPTAPNGAVSPPGGLVGGPLSLGT